MRNKMVCIGTGPGPKNVLAEDPYGNRTVVAYATWKHRLKDEEWRVMPEIQTVILNVEEGRRKDGSTIVSKTGSKLHKIKVDAYSEAIACWDPAMSQVASSFIGKQVVLDVGSKPSGDFQNYTLYAIRLDGDGTVTLEPNKIPAPVSEAAQPTRGTHNTGGMDEATVQRITRLSCLSSAATFLAEDQQATHQDLLDMADIFVNYAFNGPGR